MKALKRDPRGSEQLWRRLAYGWGNEGFSSSSEYLAAVAEAALDTQGPVLECGSGLTTLALAAASNVTGNEVWVLEAEEEWYLRIRGALDRFRLPAKVLHTSMRGYGDFEWYDVDRQRLPRFSLVVCDGPPGRTRGGRYGLLPVLGDRLCEGATILVDDVGRTGERSIVRRWERERPIHAEIRGAEKPYAVVTVA